jgi:hypothetical protein
MKTPNQPELTEPTKSSSDRKKLLSPLLMNSIAAFNMQEYITMHP